jgi:hypothetical protein
MPRLGGDAGELFDAELGVTWGGEVGRVALRTLERARIGDVEIDRAQTRPASAHGEDVGDRTGGDPGSTTHEANVLLPPLGDTHVNSHNPMGQDAPIPNLGGECADRVDAWGEGAQWV